MIRKNILVIDDNPNDLLMAKFVIMRMGFNPILLDNPKKIIDCLQNNSIAVIILDYEMPEQSGIEVIKKIKNKPIYAHIPIVMLTSNSSAQHVKEVIVLGAVDYIVKPIDPEIFESKISKLIKTDIESHKQQWVEYQINQTKKTEIKIYNFSQIVSIGEVSLTLQTNQEYPIGYTFFCDSTLFKDLEVKNPALKVESSMKTNEGYLIRCAMLGLSEAELKKIRLYQKLLIPKKSA